MACRIIASAGFQHPSIMFDILPPLTVQGHSELISKQAFGPPQNKNTHVGCEIAGHGPLDPITELDPRLLDPQATCAFGGRFLPAARPLRQVLGYKLASSSAHMALGDFTPNQRLAMAA